jgi:hypothetical protein
MPSEDWQVTSTQSFGLLPPNLIQSLAVHEVENAGIVFVLAAESHRAGLATRSVQASQRKTIASSELSRESKECGEVVDGHSADLRVVAVVLLDEV